MPRSWPMPASTPLDDLCSLTPSSVVIGPDYEGLLALFPQNYHEPY